MSTKMELKIKTGTGGKITRAVLAAFPQNRRAAAPARSLCGLLLLSGSLRFPP
jgi:hypothetical protein